MYGEELRDWWDNDGSKAVSRGMVAWEGSNPEAKRTDSKFGLYMTRWTNPNPLKVVKSIDSVSDNTTAAAPF